MIEKKFVPEVRVLYVVNKRIFMVIFFLNINCFIITIDKFTFNLKHNSKESVDGK